MDNHVISSSDFDTQSGKESIIMYMRNLGAELSKLQMEVKEVTEELKKPAKHYRPIGP